MLPPQGVNRRLLYWLLAGIALTAITGYRWGTGVSAWFASAPWLAYAVMTRKLRARLILLGAVMLGVNLGVARIISPPIPFAMTFAYGVPGALLLFVALLSGAALIRRWGWHAGALAYASIATLLDWVTFALSPAGTWGTASVSQVDDLALLQLAALGGPALISWLVAWSNGVGAILLAARLRRGRLIHAGMVLAVVVAAHVLGAVRLDGALPAKTVRVAAVTTSLGPGPQGLPPPDAIAREREVLFDKTARAFDDGAQLAVWNEAATLIAPDEEPALLDRAQSLAAEHHADFVMAYGVVLSRAPLRFDNVYAWVAGDGEVLERYQKHHPVPGEGSLKGTAKLRTLERPFGRTAGAICYDYDFPTMSRAQGRLGAELVAVPSSDWRGIDPDHGEISRIRAIEGGFTVVRPARNATSFVFDAYGRVVASMPASGSGVLLADAPVLHLETPYARLGDWPAAAAALHLIVAALRRALARFHLMPPRVRAGRRSV
jgi:apolipoprotein N-acyltransferase